MRPGRRSRKSRRRPSTTGAGVPDRSTQSSNAIGTGARAVSVMLKPWVSRRAIHSEGERLRTWLGSRRSSTSFIQSAVGPSSGQDVSAIIRTASVATTRCHSETALFRSWKWWAAVRHVSRSREPSWKGSSSDAART